MDYVYSKTESNGNPDLWKEETALETVEGDKDLLKELIEIFIDDYPAVIKSLNEAFDSKECGQVEKAAHRLKGAMSNFGSGQAVELAQKTEILAREGDFEGAQKVYTDLIEASEKLIDDLKRYSNGTTGKDSCH
ncbi:MAG: hypothetical protein GF307_02025 [candidate division Zixibacteria bacterium]|nr:hypothetical protein [candidate division Zixibacteria bacterium]